MQKIDLGMVIQEAITKFSQNRFGDKPPVSVVIPSALPNVPWENRSLKDFVRMFLYEALLTNDPDAAVQVSLRRRVEFKDLNAFLGLQPDYWVQLRVLGQGLKIGEGVIEDLFADVGYRCEEWVGVEGSEARLGIFAANGAPETKMVLCLESLRHRLKCDLLLPVAVCPALPSLITGGEFEEVLQP